MGWGRGVQGDGGGVAWGRGQGGARGAGMGEGNGGGERGQPAR